MFCSLAALRFGSLVERSIAGDVSSPLLIRGTGFRSPTTRRYAMAEHPNVAPIRNMFAAFAKGDLAAPNDLFAEGVVWH